MMAAADLLALTALFFYFQFLAFQSLFPPILHNIGCKLILFSSHVSYTQSMWCWLFMSGLRYFATTRPIRYTTLWRIPCTAMSLSLFGAVTENVWLLFTVYHKSITTYTNGKEEIQHGICTQDFNVGIINLKNKYFVIVFAFYFLKFLNMEYNIKISFQK